MSDIAVKQETAEREPRQAAAPAPLVPPVDVYEDHDAITLMADMPGVAKDDVDVRIDKDVLTLRGRIGDYVPEEARPLYAEFSGREYARSFTVGPEIDVDRIEAKMEAGVLRVTLPKVEAVKPRRIEVRAA
ncbi:Hsp20/alpha crystallin family protein [Dissulfurirhabdus thermomarina]|uniref:Hsp20/alpha crystallin family protein n=1 Tax=Dissulfurirhabdus thermomarina TaxID=1765737 RepID=A0A6N9TQP4_DISTH|nr:Hsp20/alpha crystallin family protein [Dissulfurirhabdus thermomarina]NDY42044.1 Hsp20/alpha crystallin family protein [Dissulfurirhabdus thermomarina]NMX22336.1 Hsp20/alpha crystallin family protein [Dissulfurirhabdus thermomarina]